MCYAQSWTDRYECFWEKPATSTDITDVPHAADSDKSDQAEVHQEVTRTERGRPDGGGWRLTLINILLPTALEDLAGEQNTDMDFLSRENSSVNSFFIRCLITWGNKRDGSINKWLYPDTIWTPRSWAKDSNSMVKWFKVIFLKEIRLFFKFWKNPKCRWCCWYVMAKDGSRIMIRLSVLCFKNINNVLNT